MSKYERIDISAAKRKSSDQIDKLLSDSPSNSFFTVEDRNSVVGYLWLIERDATVFVAYLYVLSRFRRRGYGTRIMKWVESHAVKVDARRVVLHVFAANTAAIELYEKCGFTKSNIQMLKCLA